MVVRSHLRPRIQWGYAQHTDLLKTTNTINARHILAGLKSGFGPTVRNLTGAEAQAKVAKIRSELNGGRKLEDLVKEYSDDSDGMDKGGLCEGISMNSIKCMAMHQEFV